MIKLFKVQLKNECEPIYVVSCNFDDAMKTVLASQTPKPRVSEITYLVNNVLVSKNLQEEASNEDI